MKGLRQQNAVLVNGEHEAMEGPAVKMEGARELCEVETTGQLGFL